MFQQQPANDQGAERDFVLLIMGCLTSKTQTETLQMHKCAQD